MNKILNEFVYNIQFICTFYSELYFYSEKSATEDVDQKKESGEKEEKNQKEQVLVYQTLRLEKLK